MEMANRTPDGWRKVAWLGVVVGGAVSITANVLHTLIPTDDVVEQLGAGSAALEKWTPEPGAIFTAAFWPILLFFCIEILIRSPWPKDDWRSVAIQLAIVPVGFGAAWTSYWHLQDLLDHYGEDKVSSHIGPLAIDGLMVLAAGALALCGTRSAAVQTSTGPVEDLSDRTAADLSDPSGPDLTDRTSDLEVQKSGPQEVRGPDLADLRVTNLADRRSGPGGRTAKPGPDLDRVAELIELARPHFAGTKTTPSRAKVIDHFKTREVPCSTDLAGAVAAALKSETKESARG